MFRRVLDMGRESQDPAVLGGPGDPGAADGSGLSEQGVALWTLTVLALLAVGIIGGVRLVLLGLGWLWEGVEPVYAVDVSSTADISRNPLTWEGLRFTACCLTPLVVAAGLSVLMWRFRPHLGRWHDVWKWPLVGLTVVAVPVTLWLTVAVWLFTGFAGPT